VTFGSSSFAGSRVAGISASLGTHRQTDAFVAHVLLLTPTRLEGKGERFRPYRTVAAWYCWQAVREQRKLRK